MPPKIKNNPVIFKQSKVKLKVNKQKNNIKELEKDLCMQKCNNCDIKLLYRFIECFGFIYTDYLFGCLLPCLD